MRWNPAWISTCLQVKEVKETTEDLPRVQITKSGQLVPERSADNNINLLAPEISQAF